MSEKLPHGRARMNAAMIATTRAANDALRASLAVLPDPRAYIYSMTDEMVAALLSAVPRGGSLCLSHHHAVELRPFGLVDFRTRCLTAFGASVYRALKDEES